MMVGSGWWQSALWLWAVHVYIFAFREIYNLCECPCSLRQENSLPWLGWCLGVAALWLTLSLSLACFALLGAVGQGWLGREGTALPWWHSAWPAHYAPRHCEGWGRICPPAMALVPERCGWLFGVQ